MRAAAQPEVGEVDVVEGRQGPAPIEDDRLESPPVRELHDREATRPPGALTLGPMSVHEPVAEPVEVVEEDFGAELSDDELGELLVREITIDGMCGVY